MLSFTISSAVHIFGLFFPNAQQKGSRFKVGVKRSRSRSVCVRKAFAKRPQSSTSVAHDLLKIIAKRRTVVTFGRQPSHGAGGSWSRNAELWSLLDLPLERGEERRGEERRGEERSEEIREEGEERGEEKGEEIGENIEERREDDPGPKCRAWGVFFVFAMYVSCVCIRLRASYNPVSEALVIGEIQGTTSPL